MCTRGQRRSASPPRDQPRMLRELVAERPRRQLGVQQPQLDAARGELVELREHRDVRAASSSSAAGPARARRSSTISSLTFAVAIHTLTFAPSTAAITRS